MELSRGGAPAVYPGVHSTTELDVKILVTGATGVIGRRAVPLLIQAGHSVTAVGRNAQRMAALGHAGASVLTLDLFDRDAVQRAVRGHDVVVNLATHMPATTMRSMLPGAWRENDRIRREGSAILVDAALAGGVSRFIQESFAPVYADAGARWVDENHLIRPARYNRTVLDAEQSAARFRERGRVGIVLRFAYFYGSDARHMPDMLTMVRKGIAPLPGRPDAFVSSISHDDAATAVVAALGLGAGAYNVCDDEPVTRQAWHDALADAFHLAHPKPAPAWMAKLFGSVGELLSRSVRMSNRKLRESGWAPTYPSVREGFRAMAAEMEEGATRAVA